MHWIIPLMVSVLFSGCVGAGTDNSTGLDDVSLAESWEMGQPSVKVVSNVSGGPWAANIHARPTVADVDGDGNDEILVHGNDRQVRILDPEGGQMLGTLPVTYPASWHAESVLNDVAVGSLDGVGHHVVVAGPSAVVTAWNVEAGEPMQITRAWEVRTDTCHNGSGMDAPAVLVDLDGEPGMEILVQTEQVGLYALRGDGSILWQHCWAGGNSAPVADDMDGDGDVEAVFASDSGFIAVFDGATGAPQWTFDASAGPNGVKPASIVTAPTIAEIDGKPPKEILFTARNAPRDDPDAYATSHMAIFAIHQDPATYRAALLWQREPDWANPMSNTRLVVGDVEGDGLADIFGMDWNTIGHYPGEWEPFDESHVFRLDADGDDVWVRSMPAWWSNKDIALMDADGDGKEDVLVAAPRGEQDGVWRLDSADGSPQGFLSSGEWSLSTGPVLTDDGFVVVGNLEGERRCAVLLYRLGAA